ncbi:ABC-transporter, subfamily A member 03 [Frankliniella occidentalis]|uniref:Phospholipid-transporting ATPase ABCA1-like n=1 Tax=Frankliniella occidentalis TaxID=133901 RepID=A0A9C6XCP3_FRAOC|nr:phospholipid-transporting ATPase ABCA1-like [Frankliniella occidentalis]KAE8736684.1 ABC-transporter, subfamily A member 03 [Frankliniella occidentalis]
MGYLHKLRLLLWKNFLIRRRNKTRLVIELVYPLLLFVIIVALKPSSSGTTSRANECHYKEKAMPSAGQLPFLHSFIFNAPNLCSGDGSDPFLRSPRSVGGSHMHRTRAGTSSGNGTVPDESEECKTVGEVIRELTVFLDWDVMKPFITGKILYYPDTKATRAIMKEVNNTFNELTDFSTLPPELLEVLLKMRPYLRPVFKTFGELFEKCVNREKVQAVTSENALKEAFQLQRANNLWALVYFDEAGNDDLAPFVKYSIRMDQTRIGSVKTSSSFGSGAKHLDYPLTDLKSITYGFAYLQDMIDSAVIGLHTGRTAKMRPGRLLKQFPTPAIEVDTLASMLTQLMPLMMVLAWVYTFSQTVKSVVLEKQERVKEVLAVMGMSRGVQWSGWVVEGLRSSIITCIILSVLIKYGGLAERSDVTIILLLLVSFVVAMLSFAMLVSTFFSRATLAGPSAGVIYFLTFLAYQLVENSPTEPSYSAVLASSLFSNVALAEGSLVLAKMEESMVGVQWSTINDPAGPGKPATMAGAIGMLWLDAVLYAVLAWYIENVFPGEYGVPKPFYFFLQKSYWLGTPSSQDAITLSAEHVDPANADFLEPEPENGVVGVSIDKLGKVFGKKAAVNGLSLNFFENQINCFLGHNGAGKTTTISMLTGMYPPTSGTARLYGLDIRKDMDAIRANMGVCPQHNVLFNSLTVEEHLLFFGRIKGMSEKELKGDIDMMLSEMDLEKKRKAFANTLSGGMKRKLSVGMAFVGGSKVVFLDEPTAGVDPFSRRGIWELLVKFRKGRTIILTTHFMDEADLLGDRIAIMSEGQLQCCGSSVFLKERLGSGYHLTIELEEAKPYDLERKERLLREVQSVMPTARPQDRDDVEEAEVVYTLPDRHDVAAITALFERLDERREQLGIASYAISDTSLEEIFLRVAERKAEADAAGSISDVVNVGDDDGSSSELLVDSLSGVSLLWHQYVALTRKRFNYVRRDPKGLFTQLVLPAIFVMLALALSSSTGSGTPPAIQMQPSLLSWPAVSFFEQTQGDDWGDKYAKSLKSDGLGPSLVAGGTVDKDMDLTRRTPDYHCTNSPPDPQKAEWSVVLPSKELVYDLTGSDTETWLMNTNTACQRNRFGGVTFGAQYNGTTEYGQFGQADNARIWFSTKGYASVPAYQNAINNVILRASLPAGKTPRDYGILTNSWALPADPDADDDNKIDPVEVSVVLSSAITVIFAMSFVPASFVMYLVEERVEQSKHLQLVSGLRPYIYWLQNYTWDLVNFTAAEIFVILIFVAFQTPMYVSGKNLTALIFLIFLYGMSCTPLLYLFHWFFRIPSMAFLVLSTGNLFIGLVGTVTMMVMTVTSTAATRQVVETLFLMLPQYCLGQGLMNMAMNHFQSLILEMQGQPGISPLDWEVTGKHMVAMASMSAVLAVAVFLAEQSTHWWHGWAQGSRNEVAEADANKEDDVLREEQRVAEGRADQGMLVLKKITKRYNRKAPPAVAGVSLGVERGQCFGLLGLNGAGKTTIFKMLTGDTLISGGDALVSGRSVRADMDSVRRMTGYCPQFDALVPLLTVREHLDLYSSLRGTPDRHRPLAVRRAIQLFDLGAHKDKNAKDLSGGNKRKLSAAIALVGEPSLLYMDEPTTSMDPVARRFVWQRVRRVVASGRSVLLTSHSMEECEALCARLTIMVNGKLTCIGSPHHLKHKYGSGYLAVVRCSLPRVHEATELLLQRLQGASVVESHLHQIKLQLPPHLSLIAIFTALDEARRGGSVEDYSVTQTTLEDVFMRFARAQRAEHP